MLETEQESKIKVSVRPAPKLAIVAPCFNEEEVLPLSAPRLQALMASMIADERVAPGSFILFVNDGSRDSTWSIISALHRADPAMFHGLDLSRNVGHQNAILAGMLTAVDVPEAADAVVTIDVDLQDPLQCIPMMVDDYRAGSEVVYGIRSSRESDTFLKRFTAESFYRLQRRLGLNTIYNHADFRLMSRHVIQELAQYEERNLYLRGIIPLIGYPSSTVSGVREKRQAGKTKYSLRKMLRLALDGVTSFSAAPMYLILTIGIIFVAIAICIGIYVLVSLLTGHVVHGWSSLILSIWLVGGMIMVSVGLVGLYVGKVFIETKHRPRYHIAQHLS